MLAKLKLYDAEVHMVPRH